MKKSNYIFIILSFLIWRIGLFFVLYLAIKFVPLQHDFLGGGINNYLKNPYIFAWANFDGENYLSIANYNYRFVGISFFPLYPLLIRIIGGGALSGLLISNSAFLLALIGLYKIVRLDYSEKIANISILLILLFPTSFYFGSVYTESLFLALMVWSFYLARTSKWLGSSLLGALASGTRIIGIIILPLLMIEAFVKTKKLELKHVSLILIPVGLVLFMFYLHKVYGDPFAFLHALSGYGEQRSSNIVLLPQVFYRYIFRIIPNITFTYFPNMYTTLLEFITATLFLILSIYSFFKLRLSYSLFLVLGYIIPTFSGSFSSLPRYVIVLFPGFILAGIYLSQKSELFKNFIYILLSLLLIVSSALFLRGYWVS